MERFTSAAGIDLWRLPRVIRTTEQAGFSAVEYRLRHIEDTRLRNVVEAGARRFGWEKGRRGMGVACTSGIPAPPRFIELPVTLSDPSVIP